MAPDRIAMKQMKSIQICRNTEIWADLAYRQHKKLNPTMPPFTSEQEDGLDTGEQHTASVVQTPTP